MRMGKEWTCLRVRYLGVKVGKRFGGIGNGISLRSSRFSIHVRYASTFYKISTVVVQYIDHTLQICRFRLRHPPYNIYHFKSSSISTRLPPEPNRSSLTSLPK